MIDHYGKVGYDNVKCDGKCKKIMQQGETYHRIDNSVYCKDCDPTPLKRVVLNLGLN